MYASRNTEHFKKVFRWKYFLAQNFFWYFALFTFTMAGIYSPSKIYLTHVRAIWFAFATQFLYVTL